MDRLRDFASSLLESADHRNIAAALLKIERSAASSLLRAEAAALHARHAELLRVIEGVIEEMLRVDDVAVVSAALREFRPCVVVDCRRGFVFVPGSPHVSRHHHQSRGPS